MVRKAIEPNNLLYHFLQHDLATDDVWLFHALVARLVVRLGVWMPVDIYARLPILVPYARRDPKCRGSVRNGIPDAWGSPDEKGYFRDDNSLVKGLPRSMTVSSTLGQYSGRQIKSGFVACHVWREIDGDQLASRNPLTYSFVPNLVWLPAQVAGLTDREGSFAQQFLQALSHRIYRPVEVARDHEDIVDAAWDLLPIPNGVPDAALPDVTELNCFVADEAFFHRRAHTIGAVAAALRTGAPTDKVVSRRYTDGIPGLAPASRTALAELLERYATAVDTSGSSTE